MVKKLLIAFVLLTASSCSFKASTITEIRGFATRNNIKGLVARIEKNDGPHKLSTNSLPTVLVINDKLEIVYKSIGHSSLFKKMLKEAINCNSVYCDLNSAYFKNKSKYSGRHINDLTLKDLDGNCHRLSSLVKKDSLAVIDFWTTWCKPCQLASKDIGELYDEYKKTDITFIAINVDNIEK